MSAWWLTTVLQSCYKAFSGFVWVYLSSPGPSASAATSRRSSTGETSHADGPTLPVQRKLAWDEEAGHGERTEVLQKERNSEDGHEEPNVNGKIMNKNIR